MSYRSPLSKARGLGSAKEGTHHWLMQRVSAIALVPLVIWFVISIINGMLGADRLQVIEWYAEPCNALLMIFFLIGCFYHGLLGIKVVIEDYLHCEYMKTGAIIIANIACTAAGIAGIFAVLSLYFKG